jgi:hypothetical protein
MKKLLLSHAGFAAFMRLDQRDARFGLSADEGGDPPVALREHSRAGNNEAVCPSGPNRRRVIIEERSIAIARCVLPVPVPPPRTTL